MLYKSLGHGGTPPERSGREEGKNGEEKGGKAAKKVFENNTVHAKNKSYLMRLNKNYGVSST